MAQKIEIERCPRCDGPLFLTATLSDDGMLSMKTKCVDRPRRPRFLNVQLDENGFGCRCCGRNLATLDLELSDAFGQYQ